MNLKDLKYLVAVQNCKHFGNAADVCCVSQPTLSIQLKKLEDALGVKLFERSNKSVHITPVGKLIANKAQEILQRQEDIKGIADHFRDPYTGEFVFGAFPTLAPFLFPKIIPKLAQTLPEIKLFLIEERSETLINKVNGGEIDFALLAQPVHEKRIKQRTLFFENFYVAVSDLNPLSKEKEISLEHLRAEKLLLLEDGHCLSDQALEVCLWDEAFNQVNFRATSIETLRQMVAANLGITLIPKTAIGHQSAGIKYIPLAHRTAGRTVSMIWRNFSPFQEVFEAIADIICEVSEKVVK